jgi:hypothetical protein
MMPVMESGTLTRARRVALVAVALAVLGTVVLVRATGAAGAVAWADVEAAEAELAEALAALRAVEEELDALETERASLLTAIERLEQREQEIAQQALLEGATIRDRIARMYMTAGGAIAQVAVVDITDFAARVAYLGALSDRDRELVVSFAVTVADLQLLHLGAEERLGEAADRSQRLTVVLDERTADTDSARARLQTVRAEWDRFQAEQAAAAAEEVRRQEEGRQASVGGSTTTTAGNTGGGSSTSTTTTVAWNPGAGTAQWRPLVEGVFANWGLNGSSCETRNGIQFCVGPQVDNGMKVIQCESNGNPMAVNPNSGTAGLFQNHPAYWQSRVDFIRAHHSDKAPNLPADASIFNPEHNTTVAAFLVWDNKEILLGRRAGGSIGGHPWPEFNFEMYYTGQSNGHSGPLAYGYSVSGKGPEPWGHWVGCGSTKPTNALGDSGIPWTYPAGQNLYDSGWIHPWATQQSPP